MKTRVRRHTRTIIDVSMLMELKTCPACGHSFNLGDPVVPARGSWEGPPKLIHEHEAVFDPETSSYVVRKAKIR